MSAHRTEDRTDPRADGATGVETTGHEWDGIRELNNPLPRWWLWTFYGTVAWGLVYTILFPAWPLVSGATAGLLGWSARGEVAAEVERASLSREAMFRSLVETDIHLLRDNEALGAFARDAGAAIFRTNCSQCHGAGAAGAVGYPNLIDDDWLWGGRLEDIATTIRHGIRNDDDAQARFSEMPAFGEILSEEEIATLAAHVRALPDGADPTAGPGGALFADNCAACHGEDARGDREVGAPNLADAIWLYGSDEESVAASISEGPFGVMPPWGDRLGEAQVRAVAAYVHGLGGGEELGTRPGSDAEDRVGERIPPAPPPGTAADPSDPDAVPFPAGEDRGTE